MRAGVFQPEGLLREAGLGAATCFQPEVGSAWGLVEAGGGRVQLGGRGEKEEVCERVSSSTGGKSLHGAGRVEGAMLRTHPLLQAVLHLGNPALPHNVPFRQRDTPSPGQSPCILKYLQTHQNLSRCRGSPGSISPRRGMTVAGRPMYGPPAPSPRSRCSLPPCRSPATVRCSHSLCPPPEHSTWGITPALAPSACPWHPRPAGGAEPGPRSP